MKKNYVQISKNADEAFNVCRVLIEFCKNRHDENIEVILPILDILYKKMDILNAKLIHFEEEI